MKTNLSYQFNEALIDFQWDKEGKNVMVNATQMAKIFDKQVNEFLSNQNTKAFINECLKNGNSRFISVKFKEDLVDSRQKSGTWLHRILALKFAAWLNPAFEVWVYSTIDFILFDHYRRMEASLKETAVRKNRIDQLREEISKKVPEFLELEQLELADRQAAYRRGKENRNQIDLFRTAE